LPCSTCTSAINCLTCVVNKTCRECDNFRCDVCEKTPDVCSKCRDGEGRTMVAPECGCLEGYTENGSSIDCVKIATKKPKNDDGFPIWAIILIVLLLLICFFFIIFAIWKKTVKKEITWRPKRSKDKKFT